MPRGQGLLEPAGKRDSISKNGQPTGVRVGRIKSARSTRLIGNVLVKLRALSAEAAVPVFHAEGEAGEAVMLGVGTGLRRDYEAEKILPVLPGCNGFS
jgi:hypothetical protein